MAVIREKYPHYQFRIHVAATFDRVYLCPTMSWGDFLDIRELVDPFLKRYADEGLDITVNLTGDLTIDIDPPSLT